VFEYKQDMNEPEMFMPNMEMNVQPGGKYQRMQMRPNFMPMEMARANMRKGADFNVYGECL
jgi:hypothetical protein